MLEPEAARGESAPRRLAARDALLTERLQAAARSARQRHPVRAQRSARRWVAQWRAQPAQHSESRRLAVVPCAAAAELYRRLRQGEAEVEVDCPAPEGTAVWCLRAVYPRLRQRAGSKALVEAEEPRPAVSKALLWRRQAAAPELARSSAAAARKAWRLAAPAASAEQAAALPPGELAEQDAAEVLPPEADAAVLPSAADAPVEAGAAWDASAEPPQEAVASDAVLPLAAEAWVGEAVPLPEAEAWAEAGVPPQEAAAQAGAVARRREVAERDVAALRPEAPAARGAHRRAVRPSVVALVCRRDQPPPWSALRPAARFARAMQCLRIALPSTQSWQAVRGEVLS